MSMMGSVPVGGGGLSFEDVIGLLKDEQAYQAKLRELQKRTEEAKANLTQAVEISRKTEESKKLVQGMLDQTTQQVIEANKTKAEADKLVAAAAAHEKGVAADHEHWQKSADAELENGRQALRDAFTAREKEVSAKEQKLLADIQKFEAQKDALAAERVEHDKNVKYIAAQHLQNAKAMRDEDDALQIAKVEVDKLKQELKDKLDKIKSITTG
jgi:hypothetical protein